jgi:hypothetical protein
MFLAKFTTDGALVWGRQLSGRGNSLAKALALDFAGGVYLAGFVNRSVIFPEPYPLVVLSRFDGNGAQVWMQPAQDSVMAVNGMASDRAGNVFLAGLSATFDLSVSKYASGGTRLWLYVHGNVSTDSALDVATDAAGNAYFAGYTTGLMFGQVGAMAENAVWGKLAAANACVAGTHYSAADATCSVAAAGFTCACKRGFTGHGVVCADVDECDLELDSCDHTTRTCRNTAGSFTCLLP